ncbi:MAG TPA: flagellar biosynthesis anti-sigma factor FlgM [Bryobacteraceae bacterium]|nr:flagellar biosynthesis anti-sigma factor FlgM [Bryobacteraceae bacterium]
MSIQIYNDGLAGAGASEAARTQELSHATPAGKPASGAAAGAEDQVQISSLSSTITSQASDRAARVAQLASVYQTGQYQVNSVEVSRAMVNHALQSGSVEGDKE